MAVRLLLTVGSFVVIDVELFRRGEGSEGSPAAGSLSQLAAGELADQPAGDPVLFGPRATQRRSVD